MSVIYTGKTAADLDDRPMLIVISLPQWVEFQRLRVAAMMAQGPLDERTYRPLLMGAVERN